MEHVARSLVGSAQRLVEPVGHTIAAAVGEQPDHATSAIIGTAGAVVAACEGSLVESDTQPTVVGLDPPMCGVFARSCVGLSPEAFIREIRYQLDSCAGTNLSQYAFGSLAILPLLGILDAWRLCFMIPGHSKFGPDDIARQVAGVFNANDTFNQAMLL
jgi:hypothetical protein